MKKIYCFFIVVLGIVTIGIGVSLQLKSNPSDVSSSKREFERLNFFNQKETCQDATLVKGTIYTIDNDAVTYSYPNCLVITNLSRWQNVLHSDDTEINITTQNGNVDNYINEVTNRLKKQKDDENYQNYLQTDPYETTTSSKQRVKFIEVNYQLNGDYYDEWYIALEIADGKTATYELSSINSILSYETISQIFMNDEVTKVSDGDILNTEVVDNYQIGTLQKKKLNDLEHGYNVNLKVPVLYSEVKTLSTDYDKSVFEYKKEQEKVDVIISLVNDVESLEKNIDDNHRNVGESIKNNSKYQNVKDFGIVKKKVDDHELIYYIYSYDNNIRENEMVRSYEVEAYDIVNDDLVYLVNIRSNDVTIDETFIKEFLNFTVEEY